MWSANDRFRQSADELWDELQALLKEFDRSWRRGERPVLDDHLRQASVPRALALPELVRLDLENRLKAGEPARFEEYLAAYPELAGTPGAVIELIAAEYELRRRFETGLTPQEYLSRFPQYQVTLSARLRAPTDEPTGADSGAKPLETSSGSDQPLIGASAPLWPAPGHGPVGLAPGGYEILGEVGRGGMGVVYRAHDHKRNLVVALKTLPRLDPAALLRFKQEFRTLATVAHPNLVTLYEMIADAGQWYLAMEYVEGSDFLSYVRQEGERESADLMTGEFEPGLPGQTDVGSHRVGGLGAAALGRLRDALRQLTEGIEALHQAGKLHRDIKPSNVVVTPSGRVVLLDFGLAAEMDRAGLHQSTEHGQRIVGTVAYMAPEQAGARVVSAASDWYSVGVILYQALTGRLPFQGRPAEVLQRKQETDPLPPRLLAPGIPEDLDKLCIALLSRTPESRPKGRELRRQFNVAPRDGDAHAPSRSPATPFVGREPQLRALRDAIPELDRGRPIVFTVRGRSGVGKSALVQHFLNEVSKDKRVVSLAGRCYERESVPYKALDSLIDTLSRFLGRLPLPEAEALLPRDTLQLARLFPVLRCVEAVAHAPARVFEIPDPQELRRRAFAALRELLGRLGDRRRLLLHIDDLQWGDLDSATLLAGLLSPPDPPALLLLCSYRSEDEATSPFLQTFLGSLHMTAVDRRELLVEPLTAEEARRLALSLVGRDDAAGRAQADAVAHEAGGNPFFIAELVQHLQSCDEPAVSSGAAPPVLLDDVLWRRVARLPDKARSLLEVAAIAGRPLSQVDACAASQIDADERPALALLHAARLLRRTGSTERDEIETYHDRVRETVVAHLGPETRRAHHDRLARTLETAGRASPEVLAIHFEGAGAIDKAARYCGAAAAQAAEALAFERAASLYRRSLEFGATDSTEERRLRTQLGHALANAGRGAEAAGAYLEAAVGAAPAEALDLRRRAALQLLTSGRVDEGLVALRGVLDAVGLKLARTPRRAFWSLLFHRLLLELRGLGFKERPAHQVPAADLLRIDIGWAASLGLSMSDNTRAADIQTRHLLLALRAGEPSRIARALALEVPHTTGHAGDKMKRRGMRLADASEQLAHRLGDPYLVAFAAATRGVGEFLCEHWQAGLDLIDRSDRMFRERCTGVAWEMATVKTFALWCLQKLGRTAEFAHRCPALLREAEERGDLYAATNLLSFTPFVALMADDPAGARRDIDRALRQWSHQGYHIQHYALLQAQVAVELYMGNGAAAWDLVSAQWSTFAGSFLKRIQLFHVQVRQLQAYSALAAAAAAANPGPLLRAAEGHAGRLVREKTPWSAAAALYVRGAAAAARGDRRGARPLLGGAVAAFEAIGMGLDAAAVRRRQGELAGGTDGEAMVASADAWMSAQNIRNPARMAAVFAPGLFAPP